MNTAPNPQQALAFANDSRRATAAAEKSASPHINAAGSSGSSVGLGQWVLVVETIGAGMSAVDSEA